MELSRNNGKRLDNELDQIEKVNISVYINSNIVLIKGKEF